MSAKTVLLILSGVKHLHRILPKVKNWATERIYIQLQPHIDLSSDLNASSGPKYSPLIKDIYSYAALHLQHLDVRVILSNLKHPTMIGTFTKNCVDRIIVENPCAHQDSEELIIHPVDNSNSAYNISSLEETNYNAAPTDLSLCEHAAAVGAFDGLHLGHKYVLSEAIMRASKAITVGLYVDTLLYEKKYWELVEDYHVRANQVKDFVGDVSPGIICNVAPMDKYEEFAKISDISMLVVGGVQAPAEKINEARKNVNLEPMNIVAVEAITARLEAGPKLSSTKLRSDSLGTLRKSIEPNNNIPRKPYVIGLTGSIGSGKSTLCKLLEQQGAEIISCDQIGQDIRKPGTSIYYRLIETFDSDILSSNGCIDPRKLGPIIFGSSEKRQMYNDLMWPPIAAEVQNQLQRYKNKQVVIIEAAYLLEAGWQSSCHEIWVTFTRKESQADVLARRNEMTTEQAMNLLDVYPNNIQYINEANVVFYLHLNEKLEEEQVERAWDLLMKRIRD